MRFAVSVGKSENFWCKLLDKTTSKRNRQIRDAINKAARIVINHCLENQIGCVVFGWNKGQKQNANMGSKTNQKFVQIPTAKLKNRIEQLCNEYGIKFIETEESYTSKASNLDNDVIPVYREKPKNWKASGKRIKRGLYRSAEGIEFNADINGAIGIARKVAERYEYQFNARGFVRGVLTMPRRVRFWEVSKPNYIITSAEKQSPPLQRGECQRLILVCIFYSRIEKNKSEECERYHNCKRHPLSPFVTISAYTSYLKSIDLRQNKN